MQKPQWITIVAAVILATAIYTFGRTTPSKKALAQETHTDHDGHDHGAAGLVTNDTIIALSRRELTPDQLNRISLLEQSVTRGDVNTQQVQVYQQLARFFKDSVKIFAPYALYTGEAARLENSEKTLTFAAHLFLTNLQFDQVERRRQWKALQAKDLFERSLKINPDNDSAKVGLGACYIFGNISDQPMQGITLVREVVAKDSTNLFAQTVLAKGALLSEQYDRAVSRLISVNQMHPGNVETMLLLADVYERLGDKPNAIKWYEATVKYVESAAAKSEIAARIESLKK